MQVEAIEMRRTAAAGQNLHTSAHSRWMSHLHLTCMRLPDIRHQPYVFCGGKEPHGFHVVVQKLTFCSAFVPV